MPKVIKCPNCGDNVELPQQITGQVIKCNGCGTSIRLVAKKPGQQGPKAGAGQAASSGASMSGTLVEAASDPDAPPSLGTECSVCGRTFEPSELTEDRGRLVCYICANQPLRSGGGPVLRIQAEETNIRYGPVMTVNGAFIGAIVAGLIWLMCQAYLTFYPRPQGTRVAAAATSAQPPAPAPRLPAAAPPVASAQQKPPQELQTTRNEAETHLVIPEKSTAVETTQPATGENVASVERNQQSEIRAALAKLPDGLNALEQKKWDEAIQIFNSLSIPRDLTLASEDQLLALEGLGAATLGSGNLNAAEGTLERLYNANRRTKTLLVNRALVQLALKRNAVKILKDLDPVLQRPGEAQEMVQAAFGTALSRLPPVRTPQDERLMWTIHLTAYTQRLDSTRTGERRWGAHWLPAKEVERNQRLAELESQNLQRLEEEADKLFKRLQGAQLARINAAGGRPNEVAAAQDQERRAQEDYDAKVREIEQIKKEMVLPQWLDTFSPIVPQPAEAPRTPRAKKEADRKGATAFGPPGN